jgi:hypothetical protein
MNSLTISCDLKQSSQLWRWNRIKLDYCFLPKITPLEDLQLILVTKNFIHSTFATLIPFKT